MNQATDSEAINKEMEKIDKELEKKFSKVKDIEIMQKLLEMIKEYRFSKVSNSENNEETQENVRR
ncbi:MAG TPA: hypothetical protein VMW81_00205 [Nitrospinota bacterium]|nr:hypothetical protein [Nitrospinota bacterium]